MAQGSVIAILKPRKDPNEAKRYRPISLLCHLFKLFEQLILNRLGPITEEHLMQVQAGFRPGKPCTGQVLNLTQNNEDGFERNEPTGGVFVELTAAYDTVNHDYSGNWHDNGLLSDKADPSASGKQTFLHGKQSR